MATTYSNNLKAMKKACSRVGIALLLYLAAAYLCAWGLEILVFLYFPELLTDTSILMLISDISTYGAGALIFWGLLKPLAVERPPQRSITSARMGKLMLEAIGLMYSTAFFTSVAADFFSAAMGRETTNILDSTIENMPIESIILFTVIIAPICEEIIFRRILFRRLLPMGQNFAVVISACAFGLYHCNLYQLFYAIALGLLFGLIAAKTGRIRYSIILHAFVNFIGTAAVIWLEPFLVLSIIFSILIYILMFVGLLILIKDIRSLVPTSPSLDGCWKAAASSPGMIVSGVLMLALSIIVTLIA